MELEKLPVPLPSEVLLLFIVGRAEVFQQTPLAVTGAPPSSEITPPEEAALEAMLPGVVVVNLGSTGTTCGLQLAKKNNQISKIG